ncbi:MAG TPA: LamG domain-containing protein [Kiritimatiellia bacterium]|nr:LamG domain-containing protein [Kiritimatiellia bacterium]
MNARPFSLLRWCMLIVVLSAVAALAGPADGLLLHYSFERDEGGIVSDLSGHGRHGRVQGPVWIADGVEGGAYHFRNEGDIIETSDEGLPMGDAPRAVAWWFSLDSLRPPHITTDMINYGTLAPAQFFATCIDWRVGRDSPTFSPYGWAVVSARRVERIGVWRHAVLNYHGNGRFEYYVDGEPSPTRNEAPRPIQTRPGGRFLLGSYSADIHGLDGRIDEVRVYGRALSPEDIAALYAQGAEAAAASRARAGHSGGAVEDAAQRHEPRVQRLESIGVPSGAATVQRDARGTVANQAAQPDVSVTRIGFSTTEDGDQDVTIFYLDETLHVRVQDVELNPADTNHLVRVSIYQRSDREGQADLAVDMTPKKDGHFHAALPLTSLRAGRALVDIAGYDLNGRVLRLFRTAPIELRAPSGD